MNKIYKFTIYGNHKSKTGNALPKLKMTGGQHWTPGAKNYVAWKKHVVDQFTSQLLNTPDAQEILRNIAITKKPLVLGPKGATMKLKIYWADEKHCDPENAFGSIADALFVNDKHLNGSFVAKHVNDEGGRSDGLIDVEIIIN